MVEVPLRLDPYGSAFVVLAPGSPKSFVTAVNGPDQPMLTWGTEGNIEAEFFVPGNYKFDFNTGEQKNMKADMPEDYQLEGDWSITFAKENGSKSKTIVSELFPWNESEDPFIRFFSGTVAYTKEWDLPASFAEEGQNIYLDLGKVQKLARVWINGQLLPDLWKVPFRAEVSQWLKTGSNELKVEVTNTWANQMIGDEELPADLKYPGFHRNLTEIPPWMDGSRPRPTERETFAITKFFFKGDALEESGMLGPVTLKTSRTLSL